MGSLFLICRRNSSAAGITASGTTGIAAGSTASSAAGIAIGVVIIVVIIRAAILTAGLNRLIDIMPGTAHCRNIPLGKKFRECRTGCSSQQSGLPADHFLLHRSRHGKFLTRHSLMYNKVCMQKAKGHGCFRKYRSFRQQACCSCGQPYRFPC